MIDDLSTALEVEAARAGSTTGEATSVLEAVPPPQAQALRRPSLVLGGDPLLPGRRRRLAGGDLISAATVGGAEAALKDKGATVAIASATDYDPEGDDEEDPDEVSLAVDGNPTGTAWTTEHYDTDTFAGTKTGPNPGVGLYVDSRCRRSRGRWSSARDPRLGREIYAAATGPPDDIDGWGEPVGEVDRRRRTDEIELNVATPVRVLPDLVHQSRPGADQDGRYQVEISDVKLIE